MNVQSFKQLIIVLDSSVSQKNNTNIGHALCLWLAYPYDPHEDKHPISQKLEINERYKNGILMEAGNIVSIRCGSIYNSTDSPTKIFYDGIIRAMDACYYLIKKERINEIIILGDCEHAINQLNRKVKVIKMAPLYNQVRKWEEEYKNAGISSIKYEFIREKDFSLYKKIDGMAKEMREKISKIFNNKQS